ncbi:MAG: hypothetical protein J0M12_17300, partial [Deltaproteobacteria bacterium]|nr:hypothetical protein [Deltaproteobacteria bacterium]
MLKTGIYSLHQIKDDHAYKALLGGLRKVSVSLYDQLEGRADQAALQERILLLFADDRGAFKRTYSNRVPDFDAKIVALLQDGGFGRQLKVHDIAVSDARTACDLYCRLKDEGFDPDYVASDYQPIVTIIEKGPFRVALSSNQQILEVVVPPLVINVVKPDSGLYYPLNALVGFFARKVIGPAIVSLWRRGRAQAREVKLICARAQMLERENPSFRVLRHNVIDPWKENAAFDFIRALNILNPQYFSPEVFQTVMRNLHASLREGGL